MFHTRSSQSRRGCVAVGRAATEVLEERRLMAVGGGWTAAGLVGTYYDNTSLTAPASFTRRDSRIDFDWGSTMKPGGSIAPGYRDVGTDDYSVQWVGQLIPKFSETYTFKALADDVFQLEVKAAGSGTWTSVIDQGANTGTDSTGTMALAAGQTYDVRITYKEFSGDAVARLRWSSPSTPEEVIDTLAQSGINNPDWSAGYTDLVKGARNSWGGITDWSTNPRTEYPAPAMDSDGWPMGNGNYVFQESLNQGLDVDPLMRGTINFSFNGSATVWVQGNVTPSSLTYSYSPETNTTTGSFQVANRGVNASFINFLNTTRTGVAGGPGGITNLRLMRPTAPDATTSYSPDSTFTQQMRDAMSHFTVIRYQYVANQQKEWSDRTPPTYFNQSGGTQTYPYYGVGDYPSDNGASWEYKIMLANETGRDVMFSIPTVASLDYVTKLANLIKYGSDANGEPYTAPTENPAYPPLNPNLRAYFEIENELWNWASVFWIDWQNINELTAADADANNADFQIINFDNQPLTKDANGNYTSMGTWRFRKIMLRTMQYSDIFRSVFGDEAMPSTATYGNPRIRPLYEWQYDNSNDTARLGLVWADRYFNNGDGVEHVATPRPINHWLWGAGGATYYGAINGNGLTEQMPNSGFDATALADGYTENPDGTGWTFTGAAGIARDGGSGDDIPPAYNGSQMGYVSDTGTMSMTFTIPATQTSNVYGFSFKAVNRLKDGAAGADRENLRIILDGTIDLTARTYNQGNGYTPPSYQAGGGWKAQNVFWTWSDYYYTKSFTAEPGSTHTITIRGMGDISGSSLTDQMAFIEDVRLTSVDRIFSDGIPGGGEATGQPAGLNIRNTMNGETNWARAFGLEMVAYEAGWSLGGDDGGSWVQLAAKYGDPRTAEAQRAFMNYFYQAGAAVNVFGTYAQWPSWADYYAEQGLLNVGAYPIVQGVDYVQSHLTVETINGTVAPGVLKPATVSVYDNATVSTGRLNAAGGFLSWTFNVPRTGNYRFALSSTGGGTAAMVVDERAVASGTAGGTLSGTIFLTRGQHALKVRSTSGTFNVSQVAVSGDNAPASPTLNTANDGDGSASLAWSSVAGATGYRIRYGSSPGVYPNAIDVGNVSSFSVTGLTNDQQYFFAVDAYNAEGESLPSNEKGVIPLAAGQAGSLVVFEFNGYSGNETTGYGSSSSRTPASVLTRGPGWEASNSDWAAGMRANRFASEKSSYGADLAGAIARNQYYTFSMSPAAGKRMSLSQLSWRAFFQNASGGMGITWSTDGVHFSSGIVASGSASSSTTPWTVDLAGIAALQNTAATVTFRIYQYGMGPYTCVALGDSSGNDVVVTGSFADLAAMQSVAINDGAAQRSMVKKLSVLFSEPVVVDDGAITVRLSTGEIVPNTTISVTNPSGDQRTYILGFSGSGATGGSLADGIYDLVVSASGVHDLFGNAITASYTQRFHRLFGDSDGNRVVNALDYARLKNALGRLPGDPLFNSAFDYEGNNLINALDLARFRQRYGLSFSY